MKQVVRFLLWGIVFSYFNAVFVLFPSRDKRLEDLFNRNVGIIETACKNTKHRKPNVFTMLIVKRMPDVVAYCQKRLNGFVIAFDAAYLDYMLSDLEKDQVMMHELAHCIFDEKHNPDPRHFMAEYYESIPKETYEKQLREYLESKCKN